MMRTCAVCGRKMKAVNSSHLRSVHNMTKEEYFKLFPDGDFGQDKYELTKEQRKKISDAQRGRKKSPKELKKISRLGWHHSEETKAKMSATRKGRKAWNKGLTGTFKHTEEYKRKMSKQQAKLIAERSRGSPTSIELKIKEILIDIGIEFKQQFIIGRKFSVDFFVPKANLIIECNGDYWHNREDIKKKDKRKMKYLEVCGFNILILWEHEINSDITKCKQKIIDRIQ